MKPEDTPATRQGTGTHRRGRANKTVDDDDIPAENRSVEGVKEKETDGGPGDAAPRQSGLEDRPSRGVNRGLHR